MAGIQLTQLGSRAIRSEIGQRVVGKLQEEASFGNVISFIFNGAKQLGKFILSELGGLTFTFTTLWGIFVQSVNFIYNFNFNTTDAELQAQITAAQNALAGQLGSTLGNAVGYLTCGAVPGTVIFAYNQTLGALILKNVADEGLNEFVGNVVTLSRAAFQLGVRYLLTFLFTSARKLIKSQSKAIGQLFGKKMEDIVAAWGEDGTPAWSFSDKFEEKTESISNEALKQFVENFAEDAWDGCIEAGYVVANTIDTFLAEQKLSEQIALEQKEIVVVTPNRKVADQQIILSGSGADLRGQITNTLANYQVLDDRDVGVIYGTDNEQPIRSLKPIVLLKFYQVKEDRIIGTGSNGKPISDKNPLRMRISFRLMDKSDEDFVNDIYAKQLAQQIYSAMATPPYKINKNNQLFTYTDNRRGYAMNLWTNNINEARQIVSKVLSIQNHKIENDLLKIGSKPGTGTPKPTKKVVALGKSVDVANVGQKTGRVTFKEAILHIGNGTDAIVLVDLSGKRRNVVHKLE